MASLPWPFLGDITTSIAPPEPPMLEALDKPESENVYPAPKFTVPKVYPAPPAWIVVSLPAVNPNDCIWLLATVILMIAPDDVPALVPSP